jgi:glycosyltransferase involved in cell wall biosynthesis
MVSVIVPVYNVEKYLRRCLDSIVNQTITDYECILVDDASPDNSPVICDEYVAKDRRFKIIHKLQNGGITRARKTGLDMAIGEFIMHVDSDDWIENNAIEVLLKKQCETNADIVIGAYKVIYKYRKVTFIPHQIEESVIPLDALFKEDIFRYLWGKLYRKSCLCKYQVTEFSIGEDTVVNTQILAHSLYKSVAIITDIIYNYYHRNTDNLTVSRMIKCENYFDYPRIKYLLWIENYLKGINMYESVKISFNLFMLKFGIRPYLRYVINPSREDIKYLYNKYYLPFPEKGKLRFFSRTLIVIYYRSIFFGKLYAAIQRILIWIKN